MAKFYAPLTPEQQIESVKLMSTTEKFEDLPSWLKENLLLTEKLQAEDQAKRAKKAGVQGDL
jgi:hypothetical protein